MAQTRRRQTTAQRYEAYGRKIGKAPVSFTREERAAARGHAKRGELSEYQKRIISDTVRRWASEANSKAVRAGEEMPFSARTTRSAQSAMVHQFDQIGFAKWKEASTAREEYGNTGRFFEVFAAIPERGEEAREASQREFTESVEDELGVVLDPTLEWFLGGPSPPDLERRREQRAAQRAAQVRRAAERAAAGRPPRRRRAA